jgi:hypothetical protein
MMNSDYTPTGRFRHVDPQLVGLSAAVFCTYSAVVSIPQVLACFSKGGLGLLIRNGRLVHRSRWRSIPLDQIVAISEVGRVALWPRWRSIRLQLSGGRTKYIDTMQFRTPCAEMMRLIAANAPHLANAPDGRVTTSASDAS